MKACLGSDFSL